MNTRYLLLDPRKMVMASLLMAAITGGEVFATEVYHWKDANGGAHFSDVRSAAPSADKMNVEAPELYPNPELDRYRKAVKANLAMLDAERQAAAERQATQRIIASGVEKNCQQLRNSMRAEERVAALYAFDDKGEMQYLDDKQRADYKASLAEQWERYCD